MPTAAMGFGDFEPLSFFSLRLTLLNDQTEICTATGFTVRHDERDYLITNYHVLSGRNVDTGQPVSETTAVIPTHVAVDLHRNDKVCRWIRITLPLLDDEGQPRWINHPSGVGQIREEPRRAVDVVALPIDLHDETMLHRVPDPAVKPATTYHGDQHGLHRWLSDGRVGGPQLSNLADGNRRQ